MSTSDTLDLHATGGADRVREHTPAAVLSRLDRELVDRVQLYVDRAANAEGRGVLDSRIAELEQEPDIERTLEKNASVIALAGSALAAVHSRRWLVLPAVVAAFLLQHAVEGWCPPMAVFRRLGIRTRQEIDTERFALKLLRGDCDLGPDTDADNAHQRTAAVLDAVTR